MFLKLEPEKTVLLYRENSHQSNTYFPMKGNYVARFCVGRLGDFSQATGMRTQERQAIFHDPMTVLDYTVVMPSVEFRI
ncbi:unnamed protein product [Blumeria hordei]|uniref:Uncharacterized protein n=1 Tax=Blumeria hordei TaxID=2867405 RepID=A0A383UUQ9_BLUHO|nr:unnamed protein product [Blumeria hordei]